MKSPLISCLLLLAFGTISFSADEPTIKVEIRACAEGSGTVVKGGGCWVLDLKTAKATYELQLCGGLIVDGGVLFVGAEGQLMVCATVTIPAELATTPAEKEAWKKVAEKKLVSWVNESDNKEKVLKALSQKDVKSIKVEPVKVPDAKTKESVKKAVDKSKKKQ